MRKEVLQSLDVASARRRGRDTSRSLNNGRMALFRTVEHLHLNEPKTIEAAVAAVINRGWIQLTVNGIPVEAETGDLVLILPHQQIQVWGHSNDFNGVFAAVSNDILHEVTFSSTSQVNLFLYATSTPVTHLNATEQETINEYFEFAWKRVRHHNICRKQINNSLMHAFVLELTHIVHQHRKRTVNEQGRRKENLFNTFLEMLGKDYKEHRSVQHYAAALSITPKHLSAVCKSLSGATAGDWIDRFVITEAKALLVGTDLSIQEVSDTLNFMNQSFFGKYFKGHVGCSPKAYRKSEQ